MRQCRICGNAENNKSYLAKELHLGFGDTFEYIECHQCGCLQIAEIPPNLSKYYPENYYSYKPAESLLDFSGSGLSGIKIRLILKALTNYYFRKKSMLGEWIAKKSCLANDYPLWVRQQKLDLCLHKDSKILDVGCGKGQFLMNMRAYGFTNLQGIDPFLDADIFYDNGVRIHKKNLEQLEEQFDFIMLNHSFEHMPDPLPTLLKIRKILKPNHYLLIRIPVSQSYQWSRYGLNWVSLDAPRHLYLHSRDSMALLAQQSGFRVAETIFDADGFSDWASVQYEAGIPLMDPRSYYVNRSDSIFKPEEIERFAEFAGELNAKGTADYAGFYLQ